MKTLTKLILFSTSGLLAGFVSLIVTIIFMIPDNPSDTFVLSFGTFIEEIIKLLFLILLLNLLNYTKTFKSSILFTIAFGIWFSLFELFLITIDKSTITYLFLYSTMVHIVTVLLISGAIFTYNKKPKLSTISLLFFILAFFTHLCYNLAILKLM